MAHHANDLDVMREAPYSECMKPHRALKYMLLGDLAKVAAGHPFRGAIDTLPAGDVAVIQARDIDPEDGVRWWGVKFIERPVGRRTDDLADGDVLLATRGTRNPAIVVSGVEGPVVCSPHFFVVRPWPDAPILPDFLAWQINQAAAQDYLQSHATGSHILNIRRDVVEQLPIVVPPLPLQDLIVEMARAARHEKSLLTSLIQNRSLQMAAIAARLLNQSPE
jgi:hypothetical protein